MDMPQGVLTCRTPPTAISRRCEKLGKAEAMHAATLRMGRDAVKSSKEPQ
jgi:hypothetical protein